MASVSFWARISPHPDTVQCIREVGGQAVLGRQSAYATPWLTERHGYDPTCGTLSNIGGFSEKLAGKNPK